MEILRIVVTGGVGAGKTSLIRTISEVEVVDTDRRATDEIAKLKETTTIALDFGRVTFSQHQSLHLYGTPGQSRFDFMWDILIAKAHAYILLVDAHCPKQLRFEQGILNFINKRVRLPHIIGLTHTDCSSAWEAEDVAIALGLVNEKKRPLIINVNATCKTSVTQALVALMEEVTSFHQGSIQ